MGNALLGFVSIATPLHGAGAAGRDFPVTIRVDANMSKGPLRPIWRFFGADEPNYATMKDGERLLSDLGGLRPGDVYFRAHNLLTSGDGTPAFKWGSTDAYTEDEQGRPVYDWTIVDRIFDIYLARGIRPYVEIGFMPKALSIQPEPYRHEWRPGFAYDRIFTGWRMPPRDYGAWGELVYQWVRHCVSRYGPAEVEKWCWQTWNEANICPDGYWGGTPQEFRRLHDHAIAAVRRALPTARVGGPDTAGHGGQFTRDFLEHCLRGVNAATGKTGTPLDFISFHAKGAPTFVDGHVRMGLAEQLRIVDQGFGMIASFPELKDTPIILGECDPDGCAACREPQLAYRNGVMYPSYTAACFTRIHDLALKHGVTLEGALTWAFEFEDQPLFTGFRTLTTGGIGLPVLNVFRMFAMMDGGRVAAESSGEVPLDTLLEGGTGSAADVAALAGRGDGRLSVMVWHYHDDDLPGPDALVELRVSGLPAALTSARLLHYRIDEQHSNSYAEWKRLGSPATPNEEQYARLQAAGALCEIESSPHVLPLVQGSSTLSFTLPRHGVSLVVLGWPPPAEALETVRTST